MFSMERIGQTIMRHRKACGMTQMQLANQMGISFQAVSSWERGLSCPDLDKLSELSALFYISVDELLGNDTAKALGDLKTKPCADAEMLFEEVAPLLSQEEADEIVSKQGFDLKAIAKAAPFLSESYLDGVAKQIISKAENVQAIAPIAAFVSEALLEGIVEQSYQENGHLNGVTFAFPFLSERKIDELLDRVYAADGTVNRAASLFPFVSDEKLNALGEMLYRNSGLSALVTLAPFLESSVLNGYAKDAFEKHGISALSPIMPFLDEALIRDCLEKSMKQK